MTARSDSDLAQRSLQRSCLRADSTLPELIVGSTAPRHWRWQILAVLIGLARLPPDSSKWPSVVNSLRRRAKRRRNLGRSPTYYSPCYLCLNFALTNYS